MDRRAGDTVTVEGEWAATDAAWAEICTAVDSDVGRVDTDAEAVPVTDPAELPPRDAASPTQRRGAAWPRPHPAILRRRCIGARRGGGGEGVGGEGADR